jgi:hypothetical protein
MSLNLSRRSIRLILGVFLALYLVFGLNTQLTLFLSAPNLFYDFSIYETALQAVRAGLNPYQSTLIPGSSFVYPLPALLWIEPFANISAHSLKLATVLSVNIGLLLLILNRIQKHYAIPSQYLPAIWFLAFGFAPFLELQQAGQVNLLPALGMILLFLWTDEDHFHPLLAALAISIAILVKVSPLYLLILPLRQKRWQVLAYTAGFCALFCLIAGLRYGWEPYLHYPAALQSLANYAPPADWNAQGLGSKLTFFAQAFVSTDLTSVTATIQRVAALLLLSCTLLSAWLSTPTQPREPLFIIATLSMTLSPGVIWYHHYVFFIAPLLIWAAWQRFDRRLITWLLFGLFLIQIDRWLLTGGLLIHIFGYISIVALLRQQWLAQKARAPQNSPKTVV